MTKLYLTMSKDEWLQLSRNAEMECRHPRDHARYLLRRALGLTNEQAAQVPETQNAASGQVLAEVSTNSVL